MVTLRRTGREGRARCKFEKTRERPKKHGPTAGQGWEKEAWERKRAWWGGDFVHMVVEEFFGIVSFGGGKGIGLIARGLFDKTRV